MEEMIHRVIAYIAFGLKYPGLIPITRYVNKDQWLSHDLMKTRQEQDLINLIAFAYQNVPYYRQSFDALSLRPESIKTVRDLEKLPILNKRIIKDNWADFIPRNISRVRYVDRSTSGSTGTPFQYRWSRLDLEYSLAVIFRGRGLAGYRLGDRLASLSTRVAPAKPTIRRTLMDFVVNQRSYSCFNITRERTLQNFEALNRFKPEYILSSPLALSIFSKFVFDNNLKMNFRPKAVFTNGERLFDNQRSEIEKVMRASVFDFYGLDDGGISAGECGQRRGFHIDIERGILEVVNDSGEQVINCQGRILATSLHNFALPFIRYDTGDLGIVSDQPCPCGRKAPLLQEIVGRIEGYITTPSGVKIHGAVFAGILSNLKGVHQFQVVQHKPDEVLIKVVPVDSRQIEGINIDELRNTIAEIDRNLRVTLQLISEEGLEYTKAGKYEFVIRK